MFPASDERACILIADDEPDIREVLFDLLSEDYDCRMVASAEDALARLRTMQFDVIISDINMEGMSGLEMIPHVAALAPDTVVVMVSGAQTVESAIEALRAGAFDYVTKPFDLRHVEAAVRRALEHKRLREAKRRYENYLEQLVAERTAELDRTLQSLEDSYRMTLKALAAALETRDRETHGHSERVVSFSLRLGRELGLTGEEMCALEFGSLLHDIGKIGVPDAILRKPGPLTPEEFHKVRIHPQVGAEIIGSVPFPHPVAPLILSHHERWDGRGYPAGLSGKDIPLGARIL
ncbi:MAG TPA: HD domain-containing phosphohydrolase, partial [Pyrinomonadaceae bacterium]|nr:HD domain-containing phosphohydrolase [Pyrinomonadaceae bacterium]